MKEKQLLLEQIRNVKSEQRIEKESRELAKITGKVQRLQDELVTIRRDKEQVSKDLEHSKRKSEMLSRTYDECQTRIDEFLVDQSRKEQEITKLKNQIAASATANIITLRKENNNLRTAVRVLERTKVEKDNENAAILLQLREYQRKYGAFGSTYAYDYPVGQGVTVADGVKRASVPSDKRRCPFCKREFTSADQSKIFTHVQKCTGAQ
jgi:DNA repair exonuclease SbcCD ATPase subunit